MENKITWNVTLFYHLDPRIGQCGFEVHKIIHLQNIANQLPDGFVDVKKVTKSHVAATNVPSKIDIPIHILSLVNLEHT